MVPIILMATLVPGDAMLEARVALTLASCRPRPAAAQVVVHQPVAIPAQAAAILQPTPVPIQMVPVVQPIYYQQPVFTWRSSAPACFGGG